MPETPDSTSLPWKGKVGHVSQIGGIETSVLDNGPGRGVRIAWVDTGAGLRYKVVLDRAMDIAEAFYLQHGLSWISQVGITPPSRFSDKGVDWLRTFTGGFLTTCGLSHVGGPEEDDFGQRGLHGHISNLPAEVVSIKQPDPFSGDLDMHISGVIRETKVFGPHLMLKRTISGKLGQPFLEIKDEVVNQSNITVPHMLLYHFNFGWPLVDEGTEIIWKGDWSARDGSKNNRIFNRNNNFKKCPAPLQAHAGTGEDVAFIKPEADHSGSCKAGFYNPKLDLATVLIFKKEQLPWLVNWQHWGENEYVTALEPATHPPIGQSQAREERTLIELGPGEKREYELRFEILGTETEKKSLLEINNYSTIQQ
ncbi:aldose 1-epimerase family protein [Negadavirga shengliensis]|uniref:Aldose 1-epimerase family protein n=1 Tax=Negadavirga shengliensis TaxID=1389218 RepID=A0ABV9T6U8_9BACT